MTRTHALPNWLSVISIAAALAELLLWVSVIVRSGPLAPNGWLTYVLYPLFLVWVVPTIALLMRRVPSAPFQRERRARVASLRAEVR